MNREQADTLYDQLRAYTKINNVSIRMSYIFTEDTQFEFKFEIIIKKDSGHTPDQDTLCDLIYNFTTTHHIDMGNCQIIARYAEERDNEWWASEK